jgi:hypothetical protein
MPTHPLYLINYILQTRTYVVLLLLRTPNRPVTSEIRVSEGETRDLCQDNPEIPHSPSSTLSPSQASNLQMGLSHPSRTSTVLLINRPASSTVHQQCLTFHHHRASELYIQPRRDSAQTVAVSLYTKATYSRFVQRLILDCDSSFKPIRASSGTSRARRAS